MRNDPASATTRGRQKEERSSKEHNLRSAEATSVSSEPPRRRRQTAEPPLGSLSSARTFRGPECQCRNSSSWREQF